MGFMSSRNSGNIHTEIMEKLFKEFTMYEDCIPVEADTQTRIVQVVQMTHEEQVEMYMKCSKKELCVMLIECNKFLQQMKPQILTEFNNGG